MGRMEPRFISGFRHQLSSIGRACGLHAHRHWELVFHPSGRGATSVSGLEIPFGPGDLVVNPPNVPHDQVMSEPGEDWCVLVDGFVPPPHLDGRSATAAVGDDPATIGELNWLTSGLAGHDLELAGLRLRSVLSSVVARSRPVGSADVLDPAADLAKRAQRLAAERGHELPGVEALATALGASPDWLRHACAQAGVEPPLRLLTHARLTRAQALLAHTALPISEVARQSGYRDARYLIAVFHRELGCTPGQLRAGISPRRAWKKS